MIIIYVTYGSEDEAKRVSKALIEEKLVACANIFPSHQSLYWWEGKVEEAGEVAVIYKTRDALFGDVKAKVVSLHSYDCPCIVSWPIENGYEDFLKWIGLNTKT